MRDKKEIVITNRDIRHPEVRLSGDEYAGVVVSIGYAIKCANDRGLDLILISENAKPPVCKVMDLKKFLYEKKKARKDLSKKNKENRVELKEMRFRPHTDDHDFNFKKNHIIKFLKANNRVKCSVMFKGREISDVNSGKIVLLKIADEVSGFGAAESMPKMEGRRMLMNIKPLKK